MFGEIDYQINQNYDDYLANYPPPQESSLNLDRKKYLKTLFATSKLFFF
jgi:hypothetical protein